MNSAEIRPAAPDDAADIAEVHIRSFVATYPHHPATYASASTGLEERVQVWDRRLRQGERSTLVATAGDAVGGFVHLGPSPDRDADTATAQVYSIHVDPDLTGRGVGERLMAEAIVSLLEGGYRVATLWVVADNRDARRFYERRGWRLDGAERREKLAVGDEKGDEVDVVRYRLELDVPEGEEP